MLPLKTVGGWDDVRTLMPYLQVVVGGCLFAVGLDGIERRVGLEMDLLNCLDCLGEVF